MATSQEDALQTATTKLAVVQDQNTKLAGELETVKAQMLGAQGDADKARADLAAAQKTIEELKQANQALTGQVAQTGLPPIPDLPKGAFQMTMPVTTHSGPNGADGKSRRMNLRLGEVVYVNGSEKQVDALQTKLGQSVRVHLIDAACEAELRAINALR